LPSTHGADRWKIVMCATFGAIAGTNWIALAPVPITATRFPVGSNCSSQCAEWNIGPLKRSSPGTSGIDARVSWPHAVISTSASTSSPFAISSRQRPDRSSNVARSTSALKRISGVMPNRSATPWR